MTDIGNIATAGVVGDVQAMMGDESVDAILVEGVDVNSATTPSTSGRLLVGSLTP